MYLDKDQILSDDQAITTTADSTNIVDYQDAARDMGPGESLYIVVQVGDTAFTAGTSIAVDVETATDEAFSSPVDLIKVDAISAATLVAGYEIIKQRIPHGALQYIRCEYTVVGTFTTGKMNAFITKDVDTANAPFPSETGNG